MTGGAASPCQARSRRECQPGRALSRSPPIPADEEHALPALPWSPGHLRGAGKGSGHCRHLQRGHRASIQKPDTRTSLGSVLLDWGHLGSPSGAFLLPGPCGPQVSQPVDTLAVSQALELKSKKGRAGHSSVVWRSHGGFGTVLDRLLRCCRGTSWCPVHAVPSCKSDSKSQQFNSKASGRAWPRRSRVCDPAPSLPRQGPSCGSHSKAAARPLCASAHLCLLNGGGLFFPVDIDHNCYPID